MTTYNYIKAIRSDQLENEIRLSNITIAIDHIDTDGDSVTIFFKSDLSVEEQSLLDSIINNHIPESITNPVTPISGSVTAALLSPVNEHRLEPWGCARGCIINSSTKACSITLSNKSGDGLTFNYSSSITPAIGNYIFQDDFCKRSWITSVDTQNQTLTVEFPELEEGSGIYSCGHYVDAQVRSWANLMYLWSMLLTVKYSKPDVGMNDFAEFSVVDRDDLFKNEDFVQAVFGCSVAEAEPILLNMGFEDNGEYGHWTKYYKEAWITSFNNRDIKTPDGAPGELLSGLYLRLSYFTCETDDTKTCIYLNYNPTSKENKV